MDAKLYTYIITVDDGRSPCYTDGIFSLACCKPQIRRKILADKIAQEERGEVPAPVWIAGIRRDKSEKRARVVYIAKVDEVLELQDYYDRKEYLNRADCHYHNVHTIYKNGRLPVTLSEKTIKSQCRGVCADKYNEHGKFENNQPMSAQHCRDICGASVLISRNFDHCMAYENKWELTNKLLPVLGGLLDDYMSKNRRIYHGFNDWQKFNKEIKKVNLTTHLGLKGFDEDDEASCGGCVGKKEPKSCGC